MLNILVCDDDNTILQQIHNYIIGYYINNPSEYSVKLFKSGKELYEEAKKRNADVIFLDIDLQDSNGIKVARAIRRFDKHVKIVFITSHKNFKGAAFSVRAFGYVDKPITSIQIFEQLKDIESYINDEKGSVIHKFETTDGLVSISLDDIIYFARENRKVKIITFTDTYYVRQKISDLENILCEYNFISPHVSFLINLEYVIDCRNYIIYMSNGDELPLSQRKSPEFRTVLNMFLAQTAILGKDK